MKEYKKVTLIKIFQISNFFHLTKHISSKVDYLFVSFYLAHYFSFENIV